MRSKSATGSSRRASSSDPLAEPWAKKITAEVLALKKKLKGLNRQANGALADIGDRCLVMKEKLGRGKFGEWRDEHVDLNKRDAIYAMRIADLRSAKVHTYALFSDFDPCKIG